MRCLLHNTILLILLNSISGSIYANVSYNNIPSAYQPSVWHRVFQKINEKREFLPIIYNEREVSGSIIGDAVCLICDAVFTALLTERSFDMTKIQLEAQVEYYCADFLKIEEQDVCAGVIGLNMDPILYILDKKATVTSTEVCSMLLGCTQGSEAFEWKIDIPAGETVKKVESDGKQTFKIAHITDIHYDPDYTEGKPADCGKPQCCQPDQDNPANTSVSVCGYWTSEIHADVSPKLLNNTLDEMNSKPLMDFEFVYFTGDLVSHRVWNTSQDYNRKTITYVLDVFAEKFKNKKVFPILGNHEAHPMNLYPPLNIPEDDLNQQWLFDVISEKWLHWLTDNEKETVKNGGYYTVSPKTGFRIIVLNNNVCQSENWWNLYENKDPYGQLQWLVKVLQQAEKDKEIVHILSHIPTSACLKVWGREYNRIIERFANTIAAQFNGHTHRDHFSIYYDSKNVSNNVVINGASLVTDGAYPNFKIYTVDSKGFDILDSEVYTFDLEKANTNKKIDWYKLYSFQKDFGVANLTHTEMDRLVKTMISDIKSKNYTLINKYHDFYYRGSKIGKNVNCDSKCQNKYLCDMLTTVERQTTMCEKYLTF
ncbi:unnamed protein product [Phyllotreta striolata]|uniref:Sphingomyelin phosphodiesterase n=1 Tax=Phyllotreta striolata TaxID=444603 RepID=A0A9N9TEX7_PHYSR|nr:unnamed protein product [Phyllotreta striolata]